MTLLRTARVVVIDDEPAEAMPIVEALGRMSIGCAWLRGDRIEDLPDSPIEGVRLVFLDMDLATSGNSRTKTTTAFTVLRRVVGESLGNLAIVLWTKHEELRSDFKVLIEESIANGALGIGPGVLVSLEKPANAADLNVADLLRRLAEVIADCSPLDLLWMWEQAAHQAASGTTESLATLATDVVRGKTYSSAADRKKAWLAALTTVICGLVRASGGRIVEGTTANENLVESLNAIHLDRLENSDWGMLASESECCSLPRQNLRRR